MSGILNLKAVEAEIARLDEKLADVRKQMAVYLKELSV